MPNVYRVGEIWEHQGGSKYLILESDGQKFTKCSLISPSRSIETMGYPIGEVFANEYGWGLLDDGKLWTLDAFLTAAYSTKPGLGDKIPEVTHGA